VVPQVAGTRRITRRVASLLTRFLHYCHALWVPTPFHAGSHAVCALAESAEVAPLHGSAAFFRAQRGSKSHARCRAQQARGRSALNVPAQPRSTQRPARSAPHAHADSSLSTPAALPTAASWGSSSLHSWFPVRRSTLLWNGTSDGRFPTDSTVHPTSSSSCLAARRQVRRARRAREGKAGGACLVHALLVVEVERGGALVEDGELREEAHHFTIAP
jgi:hypothetical protein